MDDLISVILPTFNRAHCLARAIDSALGQTHPRMQVVVVDDGSTDGTAALLEGRYGADPRVIAIRQDNAGVSEARNRGIAAATGDYVAFLDSDDLWKPWKVELQLACLRAFPEAGMCWTDMEAADSMGRIVAPRYLRRMYAPSYRWFTTDDLFTRSAVFNGTEAGPVTGHCGDIYAKMITGNLVHTPTALLARRRLERVGGFNPMLRGAGEDYDFHLRTCREGPVAFLDVAGIVYQIGMPDQLTRRSRDLAQNFLTTITRALAADDGRIDLPRWLIDDTLARAHGWLAEVLIDQGEAAAGRRHYLSSLHRRPWQPRAWVQVALCSLPPACERALRQAYRLLIRRSPPAGAPRPEPSR